MVATNCFYDLLSNKANDKSELVLVKRERARALVEPTHDERDHLSPPLSLSSLSEAAVSSKYSPNEIFFS